MMLSPNEMAIIIINIAKIPKLPTYLCPCYFLGDIEHGEALKDEMVISCPYTYLIFSATGLLEHIPDDRWERNNGQA